MSSDVKSFRSPLGRVRGRGSARDGTGHWLGMKLTALALIPLCFWFVWAVLKIGVLDQAGLTAWVRQPWNGLGLFLFLGFTLHHSAHGVQVVLEDYMRGNGLKMACLILNKLVHVAMAAAAFFALAHLSLGS